ncbi:hypothetical protein D0469_03870 [Peribacillus saganii]|uniref:Uncharacterized protein n=1 Tax=Peribacillus saganii TaxID=2303992 RepID=A0A372LSA1_9BACI|nr:hypothetical protein [Peribacillus saganii]RFU71085.1 hypothetical protein D0469_03870 [Peribacillus saganii]
MREFQAMELIFIPSNLGLVKIYIHGFEESGDGGEVIITLNDLMVKRRGLQKKATMIKSFLMFNRLLTRTP